jgi:hypothetical protein
MAVAGATGGTVGCPSGGALVGITCATASVGVGSAAGVPEPANEQASETTNNITTASISE